MKVRIIPHTVHLTNRIRQHGARWNVISHDVTTGKVLAQSENLTGIGLHGHKEHELRWLNRGEFEFVG